MPKLTLGNLLRIPVPLPSASEQRRIVAAVEGTEKLQTGLRAMREEAERAIQQTLDRIWEA